MIEIKMKKAGTYFGSGILIEVVSKQGEGGNIIFVLMRLDNSFELSKQAV